MIEEIQKVITSNMPEQVGKELKTLLEEGERNKIAKASLQGEVDRQVKQIAKLRNSKESLEAKLRSHGDLNVIKKDVEARELALNLTIAEIRLAESEKRADHATSVAMGLVRNTEYRKTLSETVYPPTSHYDGQSGNYKDAPAGGETTEEKGAS